MQPPQKDPSATVSVIKKVNKTQATIQAFFGGTDRLQGPAGRPHAAKVQAGATEARCT